MELLKELEKLEIKLEEEANEKNEECKIIDIKYYKPITFDNVKGEEVPLYLIEKEVDGKVVKKLQAGDRVIADIAEDNTIILRDDVKDKSTMILMHLNNITPMSLRALQEREELRKSEEKQESKAENKKDRKDREKLEEEEQKETNNQNPHAIAEIDLDKPIVGKKSFRDLVPEVEEKEVEKVKVRRTGLGTDNAFEFYGIGKNGEYIKLETLKRTEATNQNKEVNEIRNGQVKKNSVDAMFMLTNGTNEGHGNEGFTIDLEDGTGIPQVSYYRRARNFDETIQDASRYESVPVNMKDTNQKRTSREEREHMEKRRNTDIGDNVQRSNEILEEQDKTTLSNIDDSPYNDNIETMEEYVEGLIEEAAKECKVSVEGFKKTMETVKSNDDTIKEQIEKAKDEIYEQMPGRRILG